MHGFNLAGCERILHHATFVFLEHCEVLGGNLHSVLRQ